MKKIRRRLADELHAMRGSPVAEVLYALNPVIRGQANYYRTGASKKAFQSLDSYLWQQLYKWALRRHPKKGRKWVTARYFGRMPHRRNLWGLRRPGNRGLPPPVRLDEDRPARAGPRQVHTLRSCPGPGTGPAGGASRSPRNWPRPGRPPCGTSAGCARCAGNCCCPPTARQTPLASGRPGTAGHPQGDDPPGHHRQQHRPDEAPPRTRLLRPPSPRRRTARHGAAERRSLTAHAGCLSRVPRRVASTVLRRGRRKTAPPIRHASLCP